MSSITKILLVLLVIMAMGAGLVLWKTTIADKKGVKLSSLTEEEIQLILEDQRPQQLELLKGEKNKRAELIDNFKRSFVFAGAAQDYGLDKDPIIKNEMKSLKREILAASYDYKTNVSKGPAPPFGYVTEEQVKNYWGEEGSWFNRFFNSKEGNFQNFLDTKIRLAKRRGLLPEDAQPKEEELKAARDRYARTQITYEEAKSKLKDVKANGKDEEKKEWERFERKVDVQVKMQQVDLLSRIYAKEVLAKKLSVSEKEIKDYLKKNPDIEGKAEKKKKAEEVLKKVLDDGDFEALAKEYSDDPGSKNRGGLYEGVTEGRFAPKFEATVAKLKKGEVAKNVVETDFGYHIIKLIDRGMAKGNDGKAINTYDVRHILIGTMITDPEKPQARPIPAVVYVRAKLENEKQEKYLAQLMKEQNVTMPIDFKVPSPSKLAAERESAIKKAQEEQQKRMEEASKNAQKGTPNGAPRGLSAPGPRPQTAPAPPRGTNPGARPPAPQPANPNAQPQKPAGN